MPTECNQKYFGFHPLKQREIWAQFDGGALTTKGGGLLLRENQHNPNLAPCKPPESYSVDQSKTSPRLPFASVVMPVRNEADWIVRSVSSVLRQDYPRELMEIIIADGQSLDGTREKIQMLAAQDSRVRLIDNPGKIAPTGLNACLRVAKGDVIIRVDGHCEIESDYVSRCVQHLRVGEVQVVGGPLDTIGETQLARTVAIAMSSPFGVGNSSFRTRKNATMLTDTVAFPAYTRAAIDDAGPFDEELVRNQDDEYNFRLRKRGAKILLASDVRARYYARSNFRSLWNQFFQYGYWKVRVMQKHASQMSVRHFVTPIFALTLIATGLLAPFNSFMRSIFWATFSSYAIANLAASLIAAKAKGWTHVKNLPLTFAILHLGYGIGFLKGIVRFILISRLAPDRH
jgi:succinoglycan biosynthesis protein ExoA